MTFFTKRPVSAHFPPQTRLDKRMRGFTLIEMMITIAIACILAAVAVPSFRAMIRSSSVRGAADELVAGFQLARSEAVRINRHIVATLSDRTWQIFDDKNGNGAFDSGDDLLRETSYSDKIEPQPSPLVFEFSPAGTISVKNGSAAAAFPFGICLKTSGSPVIERRVLFPARAASPVIQASCS